MARITVYSKGYCPYCKKAKATLNDMGLSYEELDITSNDQYALEMRQRSKRSTVPQIFVGEHHIGGNDDLQRALRNGTLVDILKAAA